MLTVPVGSTGWSVAPNLLVLEGPLGELVDMMGVLPSGTPGRWSEVARIAAGGPRSINSYGRAVKILADAMGPGPWRLRHVADWANNQPTTETRHHV